MDCFENRARNPEGRTGGGVKPGKSSSKLKGGSIKIIGKPWKEKGQRQMTMIERIAMGQDGLQGRRNAKDSMNKNELGAPMKEQHKACGRSNEKLHPPARVKKIRKSAQMGRDTKKIVLKFPKLRTRSSMRWG